MTSPATHLHHISYLRVWDDKAGTTTFPSRSEAVQRVASGEEWYDKRGGYVARVIAVHTIPPYVKTVADRTGVDNLLSLPRF